MKYKQKRQNNIWGFSLQFCIPGGVVLGMISKRRPFFLHCLTVWRNIRKASPLAKWSWKDRKMLFWFLGRIREKVFVFWRQTQESASVHHRKNFIRCWGKNFEDAYRAGTQGGEIAIAIHFWNGIEKKPSV